MNFQPILKYKNYLLVGLFALACLYGYQRVQTDISAGIVSAVQHNLDIKYNQLADKIEVQGKKLDSNGTYLSNVKYLTDPGFFTKLFSKDARDAAKFRKELLSTIPTTVQEAFTQYKTKPAEIGVTQVVLDSAYFEVKVGNSIKFVRGALTYHMGTDSVPYYSLALFSDTLEIQEVRSKPQPDGTLVSIVTAKSKLTGHQYQVTSNRYILDWDEPAWNFRPELQLLGGPKFQYNGTTVPYIEGRLNWLQYHKDPWTWDVLQGAVTPDGVTTTTSIRYRLFK